MDSLILRQIKNLIYFVKDIVHTFSPFIYFIQRNICFKIYFKVIFLTVPEISSLNKMFSWKSKYFLAKTKSHLYK